MDNAVGLAIMGSEPLEPLITNKESARLIFWDVFILIYYSFLYFGGVFIHELSHPRILDTRWLQPTERYVPR